MSVILSRFGEIKIKVEFTDWKVFAKYIWELELWFKDNYRTLNNKNRKETRRFLDNLTLQLVKLKDSEGKA